jgi:hypothetical protein
VPDDFFIFVGVLSTLNDYPFSLAVFNPVFIVVVVVVRFLDTTDPNPGLLDNAKALNLPFCNKNIKTVKYITLNFLLDSCSSV